MKEDPIIDEVRKVRHRISERFAHDPHKLVEHYIKLQERHKDRILTEVPENSREVEKTVGL